MVATIPVAGPAVVTSPLPPLRALQAFESFGKLGSVSAAARALGVTPGAISQQLRLLEDHVGLVLMVKDGRRATLTPTGRIYHELISQGFGRLRLAQEYLEAQRQSEELTISGMPTLMQKWLNPLLPDFQTRADKVTMRVLATHQETDPLMMEQTFRLTYGEVARRYFYSRVLFTDHCFPVCAPSFLDRYPQAATPDGLAELPLIGIDWGAAYTSEPHWRDWFDAQGCAEGAALRPVAVYSLSGLALDAAADGQGAVLAQASFAEDYLRSGRLVRLSPHSLTMPDPYYICWGPMTLERSAARAFLNWLMAQCRDRRGGAHQKD